MNFELNFMDLHEIDITPNAASRTWVRLGEGISTADPENNEEIDQSQYINQDGNGTSTVLSLQLIVSYSGHRANGDQAQDYIDSIRFKKGSARDTNFRFTDPLGKILTGACTIANIKIGGGDAAGKKEISFEVHMKGAFTETPSTIATALTTTVAAGSAVGTTKFTATAEAGNILGYTLTASTIGTVYGSQYIQDGDYVVYTSASDIPATAGQFLQMYEIDATKRVVKFAEQELASGDIGV